MRDSEGRPSKAEFPPAQFYQWVSQESVAELFERSIKLAWSNRRVLSVGRGECRVECPKKNSKVCDLAPTISTGRSGSGADWVFVDGGVVKVSWLGGVSENVGFILE